MIFDDIKEFYFFTYWGYSFLLEMHAEIPIDETLLV